MANRIAIVGKALQVQDWIKPFLAGQLSANTIRAYQYDIAQFFSLQDIRQLTTEHVRRITLKNVVEYRNRLMATYRPATVNRKLSAVRSAFDYFVDGGLIERNPVKSKFVRGPRVPQESLTEALTREEAERLLRQPNRSTILGKRDYAILLLMLHDGLRRAEVVNLHCGTIKAEGYYHVLHVLGKGNKLRKAKIKPQVREAIAEYLEAQGIDPSASQAEKRPLFTRHAHGRVPWQGKTESGLTGEALRQMLGKYVKRAGITKRIHPHSLRHTFTTLAIEGGAKIHQVQAALGHADPKTTMRYFRAYENLENNATDYVRLTS